MESIVDAAARIVPSPRQLAWHRLEYAAFIHFGMNTFTNREWGDGMEDPKLFAPTDFSAEQWVRVIKDAGMTELILTAKHHDGFCLWPSKYTGHSVKNSPWRDGKGDVVREVANACRKAGIKFGFYLSPWDRHEPSYGDSPRYNEHFKNQLRELLTGYGKIAEVWFDGANGEGPNGKRQEYDWPAYYALIRELQPGAVISIVGPDVRWVGNEAGTNRESEWSVVPERNVPTAPDIGSRERLREAARMGIPLAWHPAQVDVSIRPGWFYHPEEDDRVKSLEHLHRIYLGSVGGNAQLLLNIPPDRRGRIHENDARRLLELKKLLDATFRRDLTEGAGADSETPALGRSHSAAKAIDKSEKTYWSPADGVETGAFTVDLGERETFNTLLLRESLLVGQRIEEFALDAWLEDEWKQVAKGTTVGAKRILPFPDVTTDRVRLRVVKSRRNPAITRFGLFLAPPLRKTVEWKRGPDGSVEVAAPEGMETRAWLPGEVSSRKIDGPIPLPDGGAITAAAIPTGDSPVASLQEVSFTRLEFGPSTRDWLVFSAGGMDGTPLIDNDPATIWRGSGPAADIVVDFRKSLALSAFTYLPRRDGSAEGSVARYAVAVSDDGTAWGAPAASGEFGNAANNPIEQVARFEKPVSGRYLRFRIESTVDNRPASAAGIGVLPVPPPPYAGKRDAPWRDVHSDTRLARVERKNDRFPLADQENRAGWRRYDPLWDEFDGDRLNGEIWLDHNPGWLGRQPGLFSPANVAVRDGKLHLTMRKDDAAIPAERRKEGYRDYTSAAVQSRERVRYGYFEVKARPMRSAGSSAFWFYHGLPEWWTEIDVFEIGARAPALERKVFTTLHVFKTPNETEHWSTGGAWTSPDDLTDEFRVYGVEWNEKELLFHIDGVLVRRIENTHWHQPLTLNFDTETMPEWFGLPKDEDLPSTYSIEYIRAWKRNEKP